jgi:hypothetical protein
MKVPRPEPKMSPKYAGRLGGLIGGKARAEKLTGEERKAIAKKAAEARWLKASREAALPLSED